MTSASPFWSIPVIPLKVPFEWTSLSYWVIMHIFVSNVKYTVKFYFYFEYETFDLYFFWTVYFESEIYLPIQIYLDHDQSVQWAHKWNSEAVSVLLLNRHFCRMVSKLSDMFRFIGLSRSLTIIKIAKIAILYHFRWSVLKDIFY